MADVKISALPAATTPLAGTEVLPIVQGGTTDKVSVANLTAGRTVDAAAVVVGAGTVSTPSVTFSGDTNTGIYSPAADTIAFTEGGVEAMRIDASGNVGIGTSSPGARLAISSNRAAVAYSQTWDVFNGATFENSITLGYDGSGTYFGNFQANPLRFTTNNLERMRIDASGNVGIGASSPGARLDVLAASGVQINASNGTISQRVGYCGFGNVFSGSATNHPYVLLVNDTERMRIDASGNVGIGNSAPVTRLDVTGIATVRNNSAAWNTTPNTNYGLNFQAASTGTCHITSYSSGGSAELAFATNSGGAAAVERARITSGGEVYIAGTTDQGAYNLQVNGTGVWGAGAYVNGSDARIKDDISPLGSSLDVVAKLKPVTYRYKESWSKDTSLQPGFIAQDLQDALAGQPYRDGVVLQGPEYMSVAYQALIPLLTKAIQEQQSQIDALKARVAALENT